MINFFQKELSKGDIIRLNRLYNCPNHTDYDATNNLKPVENTTLEDDKDDDMKLTKDQIDSLFSTTSTKRNGLKSAFHHWPNAVVPFEIDRKSFSTS